MKKLCACGCGEVIVSKDRKVKFRQGHWARTPEGQRINSITHSVDYPTNHGDGYFTQKRGFKQGHGLVHRIRVEKILGKLLPKGSEIHHLDEDRGRKDPNAIVVCPNHGYHELLHRRSAALRASGNPNWRKCPFCQQWDDPVNLYISPKGNYVEHRKCGNAYRNAWKQKRSVK